jgi:acetate kinase
MNVDSTANLILAINAGSSSIKLDVFAADNPKNHEPLIRATLSDIGQPVGRFVIYTGDEKSHEQTVTIADYTAAVDFILEWFDSNHLNSRVVGVGHRIVHGGPRYSQSQVVNPEVLEYLESCSNLDPLHMPTSLHIVRLLTQRLPQATHVACFDTTYFHALPRHAQLLSLPHKYQAEGLRRYGFHGLSYTYLDAAFCELAGETAANGKVIYAHLGSGASLAAVHHRQPVDTTMDFTPNSGVIMSTRTGHIDPGLSHYMQHEHGMDAEAFNHMVNYESGLLGVSGLSADMYTLLQHEHTDDRAADAVGLFVYQVKKTIGAFSASLGGLNSLVFSGGIGEQSAVIRSRICEGLDYLGLDLDETSNQRHASLISSAQSNVGVHVLPTNESYVMFIQTLEKLNETL